MDGLICPGHVSAVIGLKPYELLATQYHKPCVVTGFETVDILEGIIMLLHQMSQGEARADIQYRRVVRKEGNPVAVELLERIFQPEEARWRGLGSIPGSGLKLRLAYEFWMQPKSFSFHKLQIYLLRVVPAGRYLRAKSAPGVFTLWPGMPLETGWPCMVSMKGLCRYYRYTPAKERSR